MYTPSRDEWREVDGPKVHIRQGNCEKREGGERGEGEGGKERKREGEGVRTRWCEPSKKE